MAAINLSTSYGCTAGTGTGFIRLNSLSSTLSGGVWHLHVLGSGVDYGRDFDPLAEIPLTIGSLADDDYDVWVSNTQPGAPPTASVHQVRQISCGPPPLLLSLSATDETAAGSDGSLTATPVGGVAPLTLTLVGTGTSQPATAGQAVVFAGLAPGPYTVRVSDSAGQETDATIPIAAYVAPVVVPGCTDPQADNYDPAATTDNGSCTFTPRWRSAWQEVAVAVAPEAGTTAAFVELELVEGLPAGHPFAAARPQGPPLPVRATIGPDGLATFRLGPYLRAALGAAGDGGRRLDLNSPTAYTTDLFTGYELRRPGGELMQAGYVLNAAAPDATLTTAPGGLLSPFAGRLPVWPGFDDYQVPYFAALAGSPYGFLESDEARQFATVRLPCPSHPLPVAWLAPGGGYGYWVFSGRPALGDEVGQGQAYAEAGTGEARWASRGEARRTYAASTGPFAGDDLVEGLRTLWGSPQVWARLRGAWVPVVLSSGSFPAGRLGVVRKELGVSFTEAAPRYAQGQ